MNEWFLGALTLIVSLLLILTFVAIGWYLIWKYLLSRFWFVRVLLGDTGESEAEKTGSKTVKNRVRKVRMIK